MNGVDDFLNCVFANGYFYHAFRTVYCTEEMTVLG